MSKYTTKVRYICERAAGLSDSVGFNDVDTVISSALPKVFNFSYPIFDEEYRDVLETKILRHYYTREIGLETVGLWKLKLQTKLNEIMPFYNQLYKSELLKFNPLYDTDLKTTNIAGKESKTDRNEDKTGITNFNRNRSGENTDEKTSTIIDAEKRSGTNTGENNGSVIGAEKLARESDTFESTENARTTISGEKTTSTDSTTMRELISDTPQGGLTGLENGNYLSNARKVTDAKSTTGNADKNAVETDTGNKGIDYNENSTKNNTQINSDKSKGEYDEKTERENIATDKSKNTSTGNESENGGSFENRKGTDKFNSTESYVMHVIGKSGGISFSKMLAEFRETFLNIDMMVINDLQDLFMLLW